MVKLTQKQIIEQLESLKDIKPRKEWAYSLKSQILSDKQAQAIIPAQKVSLSDILSSIFAPRKLAYSLAVVLFLIVGVFGFATQTVPGDLLFPIKKIAEQSQASLSGQGGLKQNMATLNSRINDLAQATKQGKTNNIPSAINEVNSQVSALTKDLKDNPTTSSETIKEIFVSLQVLAYIPGTDLTETPDIKDLNQAMAQNQIAYLEGLTLTEEQEQSLSEIKDLYEQGGYKEAIEKLLLIVPVKAEVLIESEAEVQVEAESK